MEISVKQSQKAIIWLCMAHFVCDIYTGFLNPIMPFIAAKLGFSMAVATVILSISQICSNMFQPVFGFFADNILHRFFIFWGLLPLFCCSCFWNSLFCWSFCSFMLLSPVLHCRYISPGLKRRIFAHTAKHLMS